MEKQTYKLLSLHKRKEGGYTLLEYCAGASVILIIVWAALNQMGASVGGLLNSIGAWADGQASAIGSTSAGAGGSGTGK